jgi:hypothetical protein
MSEIEELFKEQEENQRTGKKHKFRRGEAPVYFSSSRLINPDDILLIMYLWVGSDKFSIIYIATDEVQDYLLDYEYVTRIYDEPIPCVRQK